MLTDNHYIEIFVEGKSLDLSDDINVRINNILYTPLELSNKQSEYSFSFNLPATNANNEIFGFANVLEATNKFSRRYNSRLVADGNTIFEGTLILNGYSHKDKTYSANFVSIKVYSLEDIFGEDKMNKLKWDVDFQGFSTINSVNLDLSKKYWFPLAAYGVFQKKPYHVDQYAEDYTSKFLWDQWNRWYVGAFYPSMNVMELMKRYFEQYGYSVKGNAFSDEPLNNVYLTTNLGEEQYPTYNLGNSKFGVANITVNWTNGNDRTDVADFSPADLTFKYLPVGFQGSTSSTRGMSKPNTDYCNWSSVNIYDMLSEDGGGTVLEPNPTYLWDKGDSVIVIPADGFYQIEMSFSGNTKPGEGGIQADTYAYDTMGEPYSGIPREATAIDARTSAPLEIHLMKNFDESNPSAELIYGKHKKIQWANSQVPIYEEEVTTLFPHESFAENWPCPVSNQESLEAEMGIYKGGSSSAQGGGGSFGNGRRQQRRGHGGGGEGQRPDWYTSTDKNYGYVYADNSRVLAYDPVVNDNFIMGFSTVADGCVGIRKNGRSWSNQYVGENDNLYQMNGYNIRTRTSAGTITESATTYQMNEFSGSPTNYCNTTSSSASGHATCLIWLNRGDVLSLKAVQRRYTNMAYSEQQVGQIHYFWNVTVNLGIKAVSPKSLASLQADNPYYNMPTQFPYLLNLGEFLSNEMPIVEFIENVKNAFNLEILQNDKEITINTRTTKPNLKNGFVSVNDRVGDGDAESEKLQLPSEYAVKWKIDEEEFGFIQSVPYEHQEDEDWKDYADSGYTVIKLDSDSYNITKKEITTDFSYNWYYPFTWRFTTPTTEDPTREKVYSVPVISRDEWFIDNYKYGDAMKEDGYSLAPRFWFRNLPQDENLLWSASTPNESIRICLPTNSYQWLNPFNQRTEHIDLSYKLDEESLLQRYFDVNCVSLGSDKLTVEVYLTQEEFVLLKNGCLVKCNDDLYRVLEINGFDPKGKSKTKLSLLKLP